MKYVDKSLIKYDGQFLSYEDEIICLPYDVEVQIARLDNALKEQHEKALKETMGKIKKNFPTELNGHESRYHINKPETPIIDQEYEKASRMVKEQHLVELVETINKDIESYEDLLDWANNPKTPIIQDSAHGINWRKLWIIGWDEIQTVEQVIALIAESNGLKGGALKKTDNGDSEVNKVIELIDDLLNSIEENGNDDGDE